jgi:hypothetical protein
MYFRLITNELNFKEWDSQTIKISDFSVELQINNLIWYQFITESYDPEKELGRQFIKFLGNYVSSQLRDQGTQSRSIAMIALDFNYGELMQLLKKRGKAIRRMQFT